MVHVTLFELSERRIYVPPLGTMSLISYLKKQGFNTDYFDISFEIFRFLEDEQNLKRVLAELRRVLKTHGLSLTERTALRLLISSTESNVISHKRVLKKSPQAYDKTGRLWYFYSVLFNNHNLVNWYYKGSSFFSKAKLECFLKVFKRNERLSQLRETIFNDAVFKSWFLSSIKKSDVIAFSMPYAQQFPIITELSRIIKQAYPKKKIVIGGSGLLYNLNVSIGPEYFRYVDYFILGEGELAFYKLLKALEGKLSFKNVPNIAYLDGNHVVINDQDVLKNLDDLPLPDYSTCLSKYGYPLVLDLSRHNYPPAPPKMLLYEQSRGCTWRKCVFCTFCRLNMKEPYREKSPEKIVQDLKDIKEKTGATFFWFVNDLMTYNHAVSISKEILKKKLKIYWLANIRVEKNFDIKMLKLMQDAGCRVLRFGLESGNQKINNIVQKGVDIKEAERLLRDCKKVGMQVMLATIIGFPMESVQEALDTFKFINKNVNNISYVYIQLYHLSPYSYMQLHPEKFGITKIVSLRENKFKAKNYLIKRIFLNMLRHVYKRYMAFKHPQTKVVVMDRIC